MQRIPIRGAAGTRAYALVDDTDYERLSRYTWSLTEKGYAVRRERRGGRCRSIRMHREVLGQPVGGVVDHRNHNRLDNRRENLRVVAAQVNSMHRQPEARSPHGTHVAVWGHLAGSPLYRAEITQKGTQHRGPKRRTAEQARADARRMRGQLGLPEPEELRLESFGPDNQAV